MRTQTRTHAPTHARTGVRAYTPIAFRRIRTRTYVPTHARTGFSTYNPIATRQRRTRVSVYVRTHATGDAPAFQHRYMNVSVRAWVRTHLRNRRHIQVSSFSKRTYVPAYSPAAVRTFQPTYVLSTFFLQGNRTFVSSETGQDPAKSTTQNQKLLF